MAHNRGGGFGAYTKPITYKQILVSLQKWHRLLHRHWFMTVKRLRRDMNDIMHVSFNQNLSHLTLIHSKAVTVHVKLLLRNCQIWLSVYVQILEKNENFALFVSQPITLKQLHVYSFNRGSRGEALPTPPTPMRANI